MRAITRAHSFLSLASCLLAGCVQPGEQAEGHQDPHQPGEEVGFFSVTGKLGDDTCGADSLNAPAKWDFQVKLSREGSTLYWLNGREAIVGDIDKSGRFAFETHLDLPLSDTHGAARGCTVVRSDSASGSLENSEAAFSAELAYGYAATVESDCSSLPLGTAGLPLALPCRLAYALSGERSGQEQ
jgi:hypothetical protein